MSRPGWYPDPYGTGSLRWWDGRTWTESLNPQPPERPGPPQPQPPPRRPAAAHPAQPAYPAYGQRAAAPVHTNVRGLVLHADEQAVSYGGSQGGQPLHWAHVEWVAYWAARVPGGPGVQWIFQVGRHPFHGGPRIEVVAEAGAVQDGDAELLWRQLVELSRRLAEPRLVAALAAGVHAGDSVDVAHGLTVHRGGVRGHRVSLSWSAISGAVIEDGRVWIQQSSGAAPLLYVPQQNPNAVLIPALLATLKPPG